MAYYIRVWYGLLRFVYFFPLADNARHAYTAVYTCVELHYTDGLMSYLCK